MRDDYVAGHSSFVDFVMAGCIEDELDVYEAKNRRRSKKMSLAQ